jgi:hypothetical protein
LGKQGLNFSGIGANLLLKKKKTESDGCVATSNGGEGWPCRLEVVVRPPLSSIEVATRPPQQCCHPNQIGVAANQIEAAVQPSLSSAENNFLLVKSQLYTFLCFLKISMLNICFFENTTKHFS